MSFSYRDKRNIFTFDEDGYVAQSDYMTLMLSANYYYGETDIIEKINRNEEGYFDFSKSIVDVGSEIGVYCMGTNFAYCHLFEGNKEKIILSEMNLLLRGKVDMFEAHNILLSDKDEMIEYDGFLTSYSNAPEQIYREDEKRFAKAATLDSFGLKDVGFIKIDAEGMEEQIIRGGLQTIKDNGYPPILFELWPVGHWNMTQERHDRTENLLRSLGYGILWNWGDFETHLAVRK